MCCRACQGYETCRARQELRDDCCPKCRYFEECMESGVEREAPLRAGTSLRRPYRGKR